MKTTRLAEVPKRTGASRLDDEPRSIVLSHITVCSFVDLVSYMAPACLDQNVARQIDLVFERSPATGVRDQEQATGGVGNDHPACCREVAGLEAVAIGEFIPAEDLTKLER